MAKQGANKSARIHVGDGGSKGEQPWFVKAKAKRRAKNKAAKQARRRNRK